MNKFIIVTGGTKGIGKAIIEKFAQEGFDIATCARNEDTLKALKEDITQRYGISFYYQKADLSSKEETLAFGEYILGLDRPIDILVNNTGFFAPGFLMEEEDGNLEKMMNTNLYSTYHLSRKLVPAMIQRKAGHIFNMCSIASVIAYPNGGSYSISKFALYGMTKVLREETKTHNIRVTAILPGATFTPSWEGIDIPLERFMKAEDVAEAVLSAHRMSDSSVVEEITIRPQLGDL